MIANTLLGFNNDPTTKNFESINATLIKIYKLEEKDSKAEEGQRRHEKQQEKKKVQKEKRSDADNPLRALVKDKKKKGKLGDKVKKMFGMLKNGLGGMLKTIGPLLSSLGAILTSAIFLKIVAILAIGAIIITYIKSQKFRDWVNKHVLDPVAKVFTEELPKAFAKVFGGGDNDPSPSTDAPNSESPDSTTPLPTITGGIDVLIPLDHTKKPGTIPDTPGGNTFTNSNQTGAAGREREHQDKAARKLVASLAKKGIKAKIVTPEEHGDYQSYDNYLRSQSEKGVRIAPLHFDAAGGSFMTRTRAGDSGDSSFAAPIQAELAGFQQKNTSLGHIRSDTQGNATVNVGAASPTALIELGVMVAWEKQHGKNFTDTEKFQKLIDAVARGIEKGGKFEKKQQGGFVGNHKLAYDGMKKRFPEAKPHHIVGAMANFETEAPGIKPDTYQMGGGPGRGIAQWEIPSSKNPTGRWETAEKKYGKGIIKSLPKQLDFVKWEMNTGHPLPDGRPNLPWGRAAKKEWLSSKTTTEATKNFLEGYEAPSIPHMNRRLKNAEKFNNQAAYEESSKKTSVTPKVTPQRKFLGLFQKGGMVGTPQVHKLNRGGMVGTRNQATTRLSEASNNTMMNGKRSRTIIVIPPAPASPPPMPAPSGGGGMIIQNTQSRIQMKSQMNRINRGAVA